MPTNYEKCLQCEGLFTKDKIDQKFCSDHCQEKWQKEIEMLLKKTPIRNERNETIKQYLRIEIMFVLKNLSKKSSTILYKDIRKEVSKYYAGSGIKEVLKDLVNDGTISTYIHMKRRVRTRDNSKEETAYEIK